MGRRARWPRQREQRIVVGRKGRRFVHEVPGVRRIVRVLRRFHVHDAGRGPCEPPRNRLRGCCERATACPISARCSRAAVSLRHSPSSRLRGRLPRPTPRGRAPAARPTGAPQGADGSSRLTSRLKYTSGSKYCELISSPGLRENRSRFVNDHRALIDRTAWRRAEEAPFEEPQRPRRARTPHGRRRRAIRVVTRRSPARGNRPD